jgi:hypothetical protein
MPRIENFPGGYPTTPLQKRHSQRRDDVGVVAGGRERVALASLAQTGATAPATLERLGVRGSS